MRCPASLSLTIGALLVSVGLTAWAQGGVTGWIPFGSTKPPAAQNQPAPPATTTPAAPAAAATAPATSASTAGRVASTGRSRLINLPSMDNRAIEELIASLITRFEVERGYATASEEQIRRLQPVPAKVVPFGTVLARSDGVNSQLLQRFGYLRQAGQLPQLWSYGVTLSSSGEGVNPDAGQLDEIIVSSLASRETNESDIAFGDLKVEIVKLAYVDSESAAAMLKSMGVNVGGIDASQRNSQGNTGQQGELRRVSGRVKNSDLPWVIRTPSPNPQEVGLVGAGDGSISGISTGQGGFTTILGATNKLATETLSSPTTQLMVMFNPDRPEQLGRIRKIINEVIDTPARQIVIEAMVLEITSSGLEELGLQWNFQKGFNTLALGTLTPGAAARTLGFARDTSNPAFIKNFYVKLEALARDGKAEVLARPSVLTLDNRQATIRVGTDIPIATSRDTSSATESRVSYSFFYMPTGIQLNVRPRIDNEGREVSMQIDAAVSATVANQGVQIRSPGEVVLAAAPGVSTRRVQTYARIPNSTPLIIGGLISKNTDLTTDKTPLLGDLPLLGGLFKAKRDTTAKQEVIIVLTPYIIDGSGAGSHYALPKDAPSFDFKADTDLFRDTVRLRAEDIPNTAYILENKRLLLYRNLVNRVAEADPKLVAKPPLSLLLHQGIPGEQDFVAGLLGDVLKKRYEGAAILPSQMLLFNARERGELVTSRLDSVIARLGDGVNVDSFFRMHPDKCLAINFVSHRKHLLVGNILEEPEPILRVVNCKPDRSDWKAVLYQLNRNTTDTEHNTILIKDASDLRLLSHAIALRRLVQINGGEAALTINSLRVGRVIGLPEFGPAQVHTLDAVVARNFYLLQHHLRAFEESFEEAMGEIDALLRSGNFRKFVASDELPSLSP